MRLSLGHTGKLWLTLAGLHFNPYLVRSVSSRSNLSYHVLNSGLMMSENSSIHWSAYELINTNDVTDPSTVCQGFHACGFHVKASVS